MGVFLIFFTEAFCQGFPAAVPAAAQVSMGSRVSRLLQFEMLKEELLGRRTIENELFFFCFKLFRMFVVLVVFFFLWRGRGVFGQQAGDSRSFSFTIVSTGIETSDTAPA